MNENRKSQKQIYTLLKCVGKGTFGKVFKAVHKESKEIVAIKIINLRKMEEKGINNVLNEIRILSSIKNKYIVNYHEAFIDQTESNFWLVMDYIAGGDLQKAIKISRDNKIRINEKTIWSYFIQILKGVVELHKLKIIHRDLKPANIFLTEDYKRIKIGDMNISKVLKHDLTKTQIGTPYYLAPEIWNKQAYDYKVDIFSLGVLIFELAALKHPFKGESAYELGKKIVFEKAPLLPNCYSKELSYIVNKCLIKDDNKRPSAIEVLEHRLVGKMVNKYKLWNLMSDSGLGDCVLLDTIKIPRKLVNINDKLPKRALTRSKSEKGKRSQGKLQNKIDKLVKDNIECPVDEYEKTNKLRLKSSKFYNKLDTRISPAKRERKRVKTNLSCASFNKLASYNKIHKIKSMRGQGVKINMRESEQRRVDNVSSQVTPRNVKDKDIVVSKSNLVFKSQKITKPLVLDKSKLPSKLSTFNDSVDKKDTYKASPSIDKIRESSPEFDYKNFMISITNNIKNSRLKIKKQKIIKRSNSANIALNF